MAARLGLEELVWQSGLELARLERARGQEASARRALAAAVAAVDRVRAEVRRQDLAGWILTERQHVYEEAIAASLASGEPRELERAFEYSERARARSLADALAAASGPGTALAGERPRGPSAQALELHRLRRQLDQDYRLLLSHQRGIPAGADLTTAIARDERALAEALERSRQDRGARRRTEHRTAEAQRPGGGPPELDLDALRAVLAPGETLLAYQAAGRELWAFRVQRGAAVAALRLTHDAERVTALAAELEFQIGKFNLGAEYAARHADRLRLAADRVLDELGAILIEPLKAQGLGERLAIVPHGRLHNLPFAALRAAGRYLIDDHALAISPSSSALHLLRQRPASRARGALVLGVGDDATPWVAEEAREVAALLPGSKLLLGPEARRAAVFREAPGRRLIHFATHGLFRPSNPLLSALQLGDGWLTLGELFELQLRGTECVTVSACQSGMVEVGAGDDFLGLVRGFLHAGAASVVAGLWSVDDLSARRIMRAFYQAYTRGADRSQALRAAALDERGRRSHPYYWAPFTLVGRP